MVDAEAFVFEMSWSDKLIIIEKCLDQLFCDALIRIEVDI